VAVRGRGSEMKVTVKTFLHWQKYSWDTAPTYVFYCVDMSKSSPHQVLIREMKIEVDVPDDFDPAPQQIAALRAKKQEVLAETEAKVQNLDEQIQRLLAIEFKP